jgi:protein tyrosine phosphatase
MLIECRVLCPTKILCFEEICPQWSIALSHGFSTNPGLNIEEGKNCIVGEAHSFRDSAYVCSKCWEYSQSFVSCVYGNGQTGYMITDNELFECIKNEFLQHFNQKHAYKKSRIVLVRQEIRKLIKNVKLHLQRFPTYQSTIPSFS